MNKPHEILYHARMHCRFGSNSDNMDREPTVDDIMAAQILFELECYQESITAERIKQN